MLAVDRRRGIGETDIPAGAIAFPATAVIPAARVLRHVPADGSLVTDLWRCRGLRASRQDAVFLSHDGIAHHFRQRGHRANLDPVRGLAHASQLADLAQVDYSLG